MTGWLKRGKLANYIRVLLVIATLGIHLIEYLDRLVSVTYPLALILVAEALRGLDLTWLGDLVAGRSLVRFYSNIQGLFFNVSTL